MTARMLTGLGVDELFTRTDASGTRHVLADALGSTIALTDPAGAMQTQYIYEPFGATITTGAASHNPSQFTGRENDGMTDLYYYRVRYYDPTLQRFISEDPIRLSGGDINYYGYVGNDPVNWINPLGWASVITDMRGRTTTFDPRPEDPDGQLYSIPTRNAVVRKAKPGADAPFSTQDVTPVPNAGNPRSYGPRWAYLDTGDPRGRDIHGGGSCPGNDYEDPEVPRQGWCPTLGCTRGQNEDVQRLVERIDNFKQRHPGVRIPYTRH